MSESEDFLARWSRLKREAALAVSDSGEHAVAARPVVPAPAAVAFDPATLPPIESIDAATDIRPFLEANVPEDLTRAALRSTWSADPAIRDFIGIAENQWDFNDPASIPGFAVQAAADYLCGLAAHDIASPNSESPDAGTADSDPADAEDQATTAATEGSPDAGIGAPAGDADGAAPLTQQMGSESDSESQSAPTHGSALPR
jgi:Protein of unknown function (DUF3306)